eukprot:TRINITY_DN17488_c0_g1_i1.p1 TRINITY_DN17488_c0_g1~~TRINITY_DN17488_c0_g1_i1.p1  ORF type:complete len:586 (-),score=112.50 TRINITY_DN17488_c0_g1_i1:170-1729(-)
MKASEHLYEYFLVVGLETPLNLDTSDPKPKLLFQYPNDTCLTIQCIEDFCFPEGVPEGKVKNQEDNSFVFIITTEEDDKLYGICLYKSFSVEAQFKATQLESTHSSKGTVTTSISIETTRCYCLVSKFPFFHFYIELLERISNLELRLMSPSEDDSDYQEPILRRGNTQKELSRPMSTPLPAIKRESSVTQLPSSKQQRLEDIYLDSIFLRPSDTQPVCAVAGVTKKKKKSPQQIILHTLQQIRSIKRPEPGQQLVVHFPKGLKPVKFTREPPEIEYDALLSEWGVLLLLRFFFPHKNFETILSAILLEKKILFICSNLRVLSAVVMSWTALLRPFAFQSKLIPILSSKLESFLEAPCPFIVGMSKRPSEVPSDVVVVHINDGTVTCSDPIPILRSLINVKKELEPFYRELEKTFKDGTYWPNEEQKSLMDAMRTVLEEDISKIFASFNQHTIRDLTNPAKPITIFLKESFLMSIHNQTDLRFLTSFLNTQIFFHYSDQKLRERDEACMMSRSGLAASV